MMRTVLRGVAHGRPETRPTMTSRVDAHLQRTVSTVVEGAAKAVADSSAARKNRDGRQPLGVVFAKSIQRDVAYYTEQERLLLEQSNELQDVLDRKAAARRRK